MKHPGLLVTLFLLTFGPKVYGVDLISVTSFGVLAVFVLNAQVIHTRVLPYVMLLLAALAYSTAIVSVTGAADLFHVLRTGRALVNFMAVYALVTFYVRRYGARFGDRLLADLFIVLTLHAVLMVCMYVSPPLRDAIYHATGFDEAYKKSRAGWRISGLTEGLGTLSVTQAAGLWIAPFVSHLFTTRVRRALFVVAYLLVGLSVVLAGRSGVVLAVAFVPLAWVVSRGRGWRRRVAAAYQMISRRHTFVTLLALLLAFGLARQVNPEVERRFVRTTWPHAVELFRNLSEEGTLTTVSTADLLKDQFFVPSSPWTLIFGNSNSGRGALADITSDTGVVRILFGIGLIGSSLIYAFYALAALHALQVWRRHRGIAFVSLFFTAGVLVANFKTMLAFTRHGFTLTACLIVATILIGRAMSDSDPGRLQAR